MHHVWLTTSRQDRSVLSASIGNLVEFQGALGTGGVGSVTGITMPTAWTALSVEQTNPTGTQNRITLVQIEKADVGRETGTAPTVMLIVSHLVWSASNVASPSLLICRQITKAL